MNKKLLILTVAFALFQSGTSSCMWAWLKKNFTSSNPSDISISSDNPSNINLDSYFKKPIDKENVGLENEFDKLWERIKKHIESDRLTTEDIKKIVDIFSKITPEKNPAIIKKLVENASVLTYFLNDSIEFGIPNVTEAFFANASLAKSFIDKQENPQNFLKSIRACLIKRV